MQSSITAAAATTWLGALALAAGAHVGRHAAAVAWFTTAIALMLTAQVVATAFVPRILERPASSPRSTMPATGRVVGTRVF